MDLEIYDASDANLRVRGNSNYSHTLEVTNQGPKLHMGDTDASEDSYMTIGAFNGINNFDMKTRDFHLYGTNSATGVYWDESANALGVGTSSPGETLHVVGPDSGPIAKFERSGQESVLISGNNGWGNLYTTDTVLSFGTGNNSGANGQLVINDTKVGIGTTTPAYALTVSPGTANKVTIDTDGLVQDVGGIVRGNLVPSHTWTIGTGSVGIFSKNGETSENSRVWGAGPRGDIDGNGGRRILWQMTNQDSGGGDGGWNTSIVPIDHTKTYRWTVWAKQADMTGGDGSMSVYLGLRGYNDSDSNEGVLPSGSAGSGTANTNPYFWSGDLPVADKWYLIVGYCQGSGDSTAGSHGTGVYDPVTGKKVLSGTTYSWQTTNTGTVHRAYLFYYNTVDANPDGWFYDPRLECCDGSEVPLPTLLGAGSSNTGGFFHSKDAETMVTISNDSASANANATLRLQSQHGSDTWVDITENTYGNFSITGGASTRREIIRMTNHDTDTGDFAIDPAGVGFGVRIGSTGTNDGGTQLHIGDNIGMNFSGATDIRSMSIGGSTSERQNIVMGQSASSAGSENYYIMQTRWDTDDNAPYWRLASYEAGTLHNYIACHNGSVGLGVAAHEAEWDDATRLHLDSDTKGIGIKIEKSDGMPQMRFLRKDTGLTGDEVVGRISYESNDTNDANVNAQFSVIKDDGGVSYAPMAFQFKTGMSGTIAERMRITSDGMVHIGDTSPATSITGGAPAQLQISSQTDAQHPTITLEYYDTAPNPDHYVLGRMKLGDATMQVGTFDSNGSSLRLFTENTQQMKFFPANDTDGQSKIVIGYGTDEPSHRMLIQGTDKEGGASRTGPVIIQLANDTTGFASGDGVLIGMDASENAVVNAQESGKKVLISAGGVEALSIGEGAGSANNAKIQVKGNSEHTMTSATVQNMKLVAGQRPRRCHLRNTTGGDENLNGTSYQAIGFDNQMAFDTNYFTHSTSSSNSEVTILKAGYYLITYGVMWENKGTNRAVIQCAIFRNGFEIAETQNMAYSRGASWGPKMTHRESYWIAANANDVISIRWKKADSDQTSDCDTVQGQCWLNISGQPIDLA